MVQSRVPVESPTSAGPSQDMVERFAALRALDEPAAARTADAANNVATAGLRGAIAGRTDTARYTFEAVFAEGGLGRIRRAYDHRLQRYVAVKEMREPLAGSASGSRFEREALLTARLEHPAIVSVQDMGTHPGGEPYYCMRLVDGESLHALVRGQETLADRLALLGHVIAVADALAYAHDKGVIHRDLKPANILVGAFGETVVIDWGLAKDLATDKSASGHRPVALVPEQSADLTLTGEFMGTLPFMPPEQADSGRTDTRADVYAIGAILYFVVSGEMPYGNMPAVDMLGALLAGPPPDLSTRAPGLPEDLLAIVRKAMAYRADDRYPSAKELAADLHRFAAGRMVSARPYSPIGLLRHHVRRHRAIVAVASAALVMLAATGAYSYARVVEERDTATEARVHAEAAQQSSHVAANEARLAQARGALETDLAAALRALHSVDMTDDATARRTRLLALAAESRGAPTRVLRGHTRPVHDVVALADGGLVSVDTSGSVWRWDVGQATGREVLALGQPRVSLIAAATAPVWAALTTQAAHVVRADGSVEVIAVDLTRKVGIADAYEWTLSADGTALATLGRPAHAQGADPGPAAVVWDLRERPAAAWSIGTRTGRAALSPDGQAVAYEVGRNNVMLARRDGETPIPGVGRPEAFSSTGAHVIGFATDSPPRRVAVPVGGGAAVELGRMALAPGPGDSAVMFDIHQILPELHEAELSLRDLVTGAALWTESFPDSEKILDWSGMNRGHDVVVDPRGEGLALRAGERWELGSLTTGVRPRNLEIGLHTQVALLAGGRFVAAHGADLWMWDPEARPATPRIRVVATARANGRVIGYTSTQPTPRLWDLSEGTSTAMPCFAESTPATALPLNSQLAVDAQDRVLLAEPSGAACIGDPTAAYRLTIPGQATVVALADAGPGFGVGLKEGAVLGYRDAAATPVRWELGDTVVGLTATATGDAFIANTRKGEVFALQIGAATPTRLATIEMPGVGVFRLPAISVVAHPSAAVAAVLLSEADTLLVHDFASGQTTPRSLLLSDWRAAAFSAAGQLAVGLDGARVAVWSGAGGPRELAITEDANSLAFIGEDQLIVQGVQGALMRVDLEIGEHAVVGHTWEPSPYSNDTWLRSGIAARPSGATIVTMDAAIWARPADTVPVAGPELAGWLDRRAQDLGGQR